MSNTEKLTVFATGAAGFVGSHTVAELLVHSYRVIVADNFSNSKRDQNGKPICLNALEEITGESITFYEADLNDKKSLVDIFKNHKIDCVIHFAAFKAVGESTQIPLPYYRNNVGGSLNLLEVMHEFDVKNLIFSSSSTVYGGVEYLPLDENHPTGRNCTNPYGKSKYFVEEMLKDIGKADKNWKIISLRYFNPIGAHKSGKLGEDPSGYPNNLMPYLAEVATGKREKLSVFGNNYETRDGTGIRDYVHVVDVASGHVVALKKLFDKDFRGWKAYNLGTGSGSTVLEVIGAFEKASGIKIPYIVRDRRPGDVAILEASAELAKKELDWSANYDLDEMCKDTWIWIQNSSKC